jgi:hydrogenase/urease accessory protein HupE
MHRASLILFLYAGEVLAHPDHGASGWVSAALSHPLSEPDHLAMILAPIVVGLAWIAGRMARLRAKRQERDGYRSSRV